MQIKATANDDKGNQVGVASVEFDLPNKLDGLIKKFGEEFCTQRLIKAIVIDVQSFMRSKMYDRKEGKVGLKGAALQDAVDKYKPTLRKAGKSFLEKVRERSKGMSAEEKKALIAELTGTAPAPKAAAPRPAARPASSARRPA